MTPPNIPDGEWRTLLREGASALALSLSEAELDSFVAHYHLLLRDNDRAGLTSITDPAAVAVKHFLDSLTGLLVREIAPHERVADIGSGAGFPGLVLAVARPAARYCLVEATGKKVAFLAAAAEALALRNVEIVSSRVEEVGQHASYRETCDLVVSRAVAPLPVVLEYGLPLTRVGGQLIAYKGPEAERQVADSGAALKALGGEVRTLKAVSLPRAMGERVLVLVEKTAPTPPAYPRRPGIPAKRPLA